MTAFQNLETEMKQLKPDPDSSEEVLPVEPWFSFKDFESVMQNSKGMDSLLVVEENISNLLTDDSTKLLRKANNILTKN